MGVLVQEPVGEGAGGSCIKGLNILLLNLESVVGHGLRSSRGEAFAVRDDPPRKDVSAGAVNMASAEDLGRSPRSAMARQGHALSSGSFSFLFAIWL